MGFQLEVIWGYNNKSFILNILPRSNSAGMHELGIAQNILEIVQQSVTEEQIPAVRWIRIRVGQLSGIVPDSLEFCFQAIVSDTAMQSAGLAIEQMPTVFRCKKCNYRFQVNDLEYLCQECKSPDLEILSGKELDIVEIELEEEGGGAL
jgi:hydrogenase nickel incorporation protein HypA/HybF